MLFPRFVLSPSVLAGSIFRDHENTWPWPLPMEWWRPDGGCLSYRGLIDAFRVTRPRSIASVPSVGVIERKSSTGTLPPKGMLPACRMLKVAASVFAQPGSWGEWPKNGGQVGERQGRVDRAQGNDVGGHAGVGQKGDDEIGSAESCRQGLDGDGAECALLAGFDLHGLGDSANDTPVALVGLPDKAR